MRFINNWAAKLTASLAVDGDSLPIDPAVLARLDLTGGGEYLLTLVGSLDPLEQLVAERVVISATGLQRGQDGSEAQAWEEGAYVFCGITASQAEAWNTPSGGSAPNKIRSIYDPGTYVFDPTEYALLKVAAFDAGNYTLTLPRLLVSGECLTFDFEIRGGESGIIILAPGDEFASNGIMFDEAKMGVTPIYDGALIKLVGLNGVLAGRGIVDDFGTVLYCGVNIPF